MEVAKGYTLTQFCDKIIDVFMNEKPKSKEWRKYLVFREEWNKYREAFYSRCQTRAFAETNIVMKKNLIELGRKVKKVTVDYVVICFFLFKYLCFDLFFCIVNHGKENKFSNLVFFFFFVILVLEKLKTIVYLDNSLILYSLHCLNSQRECWD